MYHRIHTEIEIDTSPELVWQVLIDLDRYTDWNPFITSSVGKPEVGEKLINRLRSPGGKVMTFKPMVTVVEPIKTFEWLGRLGMRGIFDGRHRFELHVLPSGGTRLVHSEEVNGVLVRALRKLLDTKTKKGFDAMNAELKTRAEAAVIGPDHTTSHGIHDPDGIR